MKNEVQNELKRNFNSCMQLYVRTLKMIKIIKSVIKINKKNKLNRIRNTAIRNYKLLCFSPPFLDMALKHCSPHATVKIGILRNDNKCQIKWHDMKRVFSFFTHEFYYVFQFVMKAFKQIIKYILIHTYVK